MSNYSINITWSDKDGGFIATVPEFRNLSAFGKTYEEALQQAKIVLDGYIETYKEDHSPLPEPFSTPSFSGQIRLRLPKNLHQTLALEAKKQGVSLNTYMVAQLSFNYGLSKISELGSRHIFVTVVQGSKSETEYVSNSDQQPRVLIPSKWETVKE